ncbi:MAG: hypothetical protein U5K54_09495 [Cytophagales bacterium]|nr:hypothetical protein [Cytophagales bacterium]
MATDGNGGAFIVWSDRRTIPINPDIYAQGINADGSLKGPELFIATKSIEPAIISDGSGGAIITWADSRNAANGTSANDIFAQHIGSSGAFLWVEGGVGICETARFQSNPDPHIRWWWWCYYYLAG